MTREEIKQNADAYIEQKFPTNRLWERKNEYDAFIAGAHSRDEEINELRLQRYEYEDKLRISEHHEGLLREEINRLDGVNNELEKTIDFLQNKLRNPLISVKDRLPEDGQRVIVRVENIVRGGGEEDVSEQFLQDVFRGRFVCNYCKQERHGGVLYDMISRTTHWMPIPEIEK